jgi:predicted dithiol-disulfide oxidoreductase (DUF899 family)
LEKKIEKLKKKVILKKKIEKKEKKQREKLAKKRRKAPWITVVIHSALCVGKQ